jgi:hypothetical protein
LKLAEKSKLRRKCLVCQPQSGQRSSQTKNFISSQVKLLITNNAFCIVQRATAHSKTGIFRDFGVAEAPPGYQASWSD